MSTATISNRPVGGDPRSISALLANFDSILAAINPPGLDAVNLVNGTLVADKVSDTLQDLVALNDSLNTKRRGCGPTFQPGTPTSLSASPSYTNLQSVVVVVTAGAVVLCAADLLCKTTAAGQIDARVTCTPASETQHITTVSTTSTLSWGSGYALLTEVPAGQTTITLQATTLSGSGGSVNNRNLACMVFDL